MLHICVAGLLMHAVNLGGSHYAQYLGMSAGITALLLATQPLFTAVFASQVLGERLARRQWAGVVVALAGVVWWATKQETPKFPSAPSDLALIGVAVALYAVATLTCTPETSKELDRQLGLSEQVMRTKLMRLEA